MGQIVAGGSLFQRGETAIAIERSANLSDEVTEIAEEC